MLYVQVQADRGWQQQRAGRLWTTSAGGAGAWPAPIHYYRHYLLSPDVTQPWILRCKNHLCHYSCCPHDFAQLFSLMHEEIAMPITGSMNISAIAPALGLVVHLIPSWL
jgi:hypothetical protein